MHLAAIVRVRSDLCKNATLLADPGTIVSPLPMDPAHIVDLLAPFLRTNVGESCDFLSPSQLESISTYIDILVRWNSRINLTAIRDPEDIVTRHFGESLFAARHLFPRFSSVSPVSCVLKDFDSADDIRVADLGSGAGFPGLPIKIWSPNISLTLIESNHKKAAFLSEVVRSLTLMNVNIQNTRAESLTESSTAGAFDVVTLRAVEHFATILPTAAALVSPSGRLALLIGAAQQDQATSALHHFEWSLPIPVPKSRSRILLLARRTSPDGE
jgi:16S rRNA (guanine527-N7)-methyltransferase